MGSRAPFTVEKEVGERPGSLPGMGQATLFMYGHHLLCSNFYSQELQTMGCRYSKMHGYLSYAVVRLLSTDGIVSCIIWCNETCIKCQPLSKPRAKSNRLPGHFTKEQGVAMQWGYGVCFSQASPPLPGLRRLRVSGA